MPNFIKTVAVILFLCNAPAAFSAPLQPDGTGSRIEAVVEGKVLTFPALKTDIVANVKGSVVTVNVRQTFSNPSGKPLHATYLFPLNQDAAVNKMVMEVGDERVEAKIQRTEEAKQTFEKAKSEGKAAALLTQHRPNMFTQDIANLMPNLPVQVTLTYVQTLPKVDGQYELVLPLVVGPRYQPVGAGVPPSPASQVSSTERYGQWEVEKLPTYPPVAGLDIPDTVEKDRVSIEVDLDGGMPVTAVTSSTHPIHEDRISDAQRKITLAEGRTIDNRDFILHYGLGGETPQAGLLAHKDTRGGFFSLQLEPPAIPDVKDITPREMVFVLDTSGSMSGFPVETSKLFMRHALNGLRPNDYFRIIRFSNNAEEFTSGPVPATQENIHKGIDYVNSLDADGGTEAETAVDQAFSIAPQAGTMRIVVLLTDGYIGNEAEVIKSVTAKMGSARIYALGVGTSVNRYLLEELGRAGNGFARFIDPTEKTDDVAIQLAGKLESPVLTDITVDWGGLKPASLSPEKIPDLFTGGAVRIQGKYGQAGTHTVTVHGLVNGRRAALPVTIDFPAASDDKDNPIPVIWARSQIAEAMRMINMPVYFRPQDVSEDSLKAKVVDLGLNFNLLTRWTSFVAVSEKIVNAHPETAQISSVPLPMVKGVTKKAYGTMQQLAENFSGSSAPEPSMTAGLMIVLCIAAVALFRHYRRQQGFRALLFMVATRVWLELQRRKSRV